MAGSRIFSLGPTHLLTSHFIFFFCAAIVHDCFLFIAFPHRRQQSDCGYCCVSYNTHYSYNIIQYLHEWHCYRHLRLLYNRSDSHGRQLSRLWTRRPRLRVKSPEHIVRSTSTMRQHSLLALSAWSCGVSARWLANTLDIRGADLVHPTPTPHFDNGNQPPAPTPPPSKAVLELLLQRQDSSSSGSSSSDNTWENDSTCGWYSGISSKPYVCDSPLACTTNTDAVVACTSDQFYTACFNYDASVSGKCESVGPKTGCCGASTEPACGTFIWTGTPVRSMYKCFATSTVISMIDEPQYVLDAQRSSASAASSSSAAAAASRSSASAAAASRASEIGGSSVTITTTASDGSSTTFTAVAGGTGSASGVSLVTSQQYTTTGADGSTTTYTAIAETSGAAGSAGSDGSSGGSSGSGGSSTNTGAIAGGVVGGVSFLLLLLLLWYLLRKKSNKFSLSLCGGKRKKVKEINEHNKTYNETKNVDKRTYQNDSSSEGAGGGGKKSSKKEKNITKNYYYGDEVRNDNRSYDKRSVKDNRRWNTSNEQSRSVTPSQQPQNFHFEVEGQDPASSSRGPSREFEAALAGAGVGGVAGAAAASSRRDKRRRNRRSGSSQPSQRAAYERDSRSPSPAAAAPDMEAVAAVGSSRRDKRRQQRRRERGEYSPEPEAEPEPVEYANESRRRGPSRDYDYDDDEDDRREREPQHIHYHYHIHDRDRDHRDSDEEDGLEDEERRQDRERQMSPHHYHPTSGYRNQPLSREPSPPPVQQNGHADDFIGRGL